MSNTIKTIIRNRIVQHILFWILSYYILLRVFTDPAEFPEVDLIYTGLFHFTLWVAVYPNLLLLIPRFLQKERYLTYFIFLALTVIAGVYFNIFFFDHLVDYVFPGYYFISYYEFHEILQFFLAYIVITSLIKLSRSWFLLLEKEKELARIEQEKKLAELKALKAQVNPHFLFNSLNNIYGHVLTESKESADMVMKLSNVLRYMIYDAEHTRVPLENELKCVSDFIELQKMRLDQPAIDYRVNGATEGIKVAPLLFIPLVENVFKHGIAGKKTPVTIHFNVNYRELWFHTENEISKTVSYPTDSNGPGGVGLSNLKERLKVLYPDKHRLRIDQNGNRYKVDLKIDLQYDKESDS